MKQRIQSEISPNDFEENISTVHLWVKAKSKYTDHTSLPHSLV